MYVGHWWNRRWKTEVILENLVCMLTLPPQNPQRVAWGRTWVSAVKRKTVITRSMARTLLQNNIS